MNALIVSTPTHAELLASLDQLKPQYTFADLCRNDDRLDRSMYEKLLVGHACGVQLLAAPREFDEVRTVTARGVERALATSRECFTHVVADLADCFHAEQLHVLENASRVILVCRLDFTAVRNARRIIDHLAAHGVRRDRVTVVANQAGLANELPAAEAEEAIGGPIAAFIPHDPLTVFAANNMGIPAALTDPTAAVVQAVAPLVGLETPAGAAASRLTTLVGSVAGQVAARFRRLRGRSAATPSHPSTDALATALPPGIEETTIFYDPTLTQKLHSADTRPLTV